LEHVDGVAQGDLKLEADVSASEDGGEGVQGDKLATITPWWPDWWPKRLEVGDLETGEL